MSTIVESGTFRSTLGHFSSGVTIITGLVNGSPVGFTCQSFSALSIDPPLIVVLPGSSSTSWPQIQATGRFCVNVLSDSQKALSTAFAKSGEDKFAGVDWFPSPLANPILPGSCAWIDCSISEVHPGGDHLIVVGAVYDLGALDETAPLLFYRSEYRTLSSNQ
ncbi:flavin reductase family protein [Saccharopolyspora sp. NPDC000995]